MLNQAYANEKSSFIFGLRIKIFCPTVLKFSFNIFFIYNSLCNVFILLLIKVVCSGAVLMKVFVCLTNDFFFNQTMNPFHAFEKSSNIFDLLSNIPTVFIWFDFSLLCVFLFLIRDVCSRAASMEVLVCQIRESKPFMLVSPTLDWRQMWS